MLSEPERRVLPAQVEEAQRTKAWVETAERSETMEQPLKRMRPPAATTWPSTVRTQATSSPATPVRRVDFNPLSHRRPTEFCLTGERLTLVDGVNYNAAGAMTTFTRRESRSATVTNNYIFNTLYRMTNQTVAWNGTPIQNLIYGFPKANINGQITQQISSSTT